MNDSRLAIKTGLFVLLTLALLGTLLLVFSKGSSFLTPSYELRLRAANVGGLKSRSAVLISGVEVGSVTGTELAPDGRSVVIRLKIRSKHRIHRDARFVVEQIGLLGDQYVVVRPTGNEGPLLQDGDEVSCDSPFNLQEVARTTVGFIERVDEATRLLKETVDRVNQRVLNDRTLGHLAEGIDNFRQVSGQAVSLAGRLDAVVATNSPSIEAAATNLARFTADLNRLSDELRQAVAENREGLTNAVGRLGETAAALGRIATDLEAGKGVAGGLLKDEALRRSLTQAVLNLEAASSNVANYGLLYKPRKPRKDENTPSREPLRSPKYQ